MSPTPALLAALPVLAGRTGEVCTPLQGVAHLLGGPGGVTLSTVKIAAAEGLHILLYASNASNAPIPSTQVAFQPPPFLTASYVGANGAPLAPGVGGGIPLGPLAPGAFTSLVITLTLCAIPGAGALNVQVSPPPAMGAPAAALEIAVRDVLRPAPIDTPSFGAVWTQPAMGGEATYVIPGCPNSAPDAVLARVPSMRFNPVQAIAASEWGGGGVHLPSLLLTLFSPCSPFTHTNTPTHFTPHFNPHIRLTLQRKKQSLQRVSWQCPMCMHCCTQGLSQEAWSSGYAPQTRASQGLCWKVSSMH